MRGYLHEEKNSTPKIHLRSARTCHPATRRSSRTAPFRSGCHPGGCVQVAVGMTRLVPQASGRKKSAIVAQQTQDARIKALERENYGWCPKMMLPQTNP